MERRFMTMGTIEVVSIREGGERGRRTDGDGDSLCDSEHDELSTDCQSVDERLHDLSIGCSRYRPFSLVQLVRGGKRGTHQE